MLAAIVTLAACRADTAPTPAPVPSAAATAPAPRPTAAPPITAVPQPTASPSGLVLWALADEPELAVLRRLVADMSAPSGIQVLVVGKSADALLADLSADALAGLPPPDLVWATQDELGLLQRADMIQPADDGLANDGFLPATLAGATIGGRRWGTPLAARGYLLLLYNRKLVASAPRTTDELIVQSRAQVRNGGYGMVAAWAEPRWFTAWLAGYGGAAVDAQGRPTLDTPQVVAALNLLKELRVAGPPAPSTYEEGVQLFRAGRAAFAIDGDWTLAGYREYTDTLDLGVAPLPVVPATGRRAAPAFGGMYLMYSARLNGERLAQAWALGRALAGPDAQIRVAAELGWLPALRAALGSPAVVNSPPLAAGVAQAADAPGLPPLDGLRCAWGAIQAQLPGVLLGDQAQEAAAQAMQASADTCAGSARGGPPAMRAQADRILRR